MLRFQQISKNYGEIKALNEVSFEIPENSITGLIGPNGAGKSTCMKIMAGAMAQSSGEFFLQGNKVEAHSGDTWKSSIGFLPEKPPVYEDLSVVENLRFWAELYSVNEVEAKINEVVASTGLKDVLEKPGKTLSKGYRQRLGIAKALMGDPKLLILDEPLSGLDPIQVDEIRALIRDLGKERSILFSSHQLHELEQLCQHFVFLNKGELVLSGKKDDIKKRQDSAWLYVELFEECSALESLGLDLRNRKANSFEVQIPENAESSKRIYRWLEENSLNLKAMHWQKPDLEQIFRDLNG